VRQGSVRQLVAGRTGEVAVGLAYDAATKRIWVAGGATGDITAYDSRTGALLYTVTTGTRPLPQRRRHHPRRGLRDRLEAERDPRGAAGRGASLPADGTAARVLTVTGDYLQPAGFGLNGIRVLPGGDLIAVSGGVLYVVDPATGVADRVEVQRLPGASPRSRAATGSSCAATPSTSCAASAAPRSSVLRLGPGRSHGDLRRRRSPTATSTSRRRRARRR
jgi:DNA-binding beta-propeller fold protein YncE